MSRVLVVDDSEPTREVVRDILEIGVAGCEVVECATAEAGLERLAEGDIDVLVADIFLPGRNGIWLVREARARKMAGRIVSISGGGSIGGADALEAARVAGADVVLKKPFSAASLVAAVEGAAAPREAAAG